MGLGLLCLWVLVDVGWCGCFEGWVLCLGLCGLERGRMVKGSMLCIGIC